MPKPCIPVWQKNAECLMVAAPSCSVQALQRMHGSLLQAAALCSVALLMAELWPHSVRFMTHIQKLIAVTMAECVVALIFALVYLWRIQHEALPDGQLYLQSALYTASDSRIRYCGFRPALFPGGSCSSEHGMTCSR